MTAILPILAPTAELSFNGLLVAHLENVTLSEGTYFATFQLLVSDTGPGLPSRIATFVRFSLDWNERCAARERAHPSEFHQFGDLIGPDRWRVTWPNESIALSEAPIFSDGNQIGWR